MRLELTFMRSPSVPTKNVVSHVNKHAFQGLVYKLLQGTQFAQLHDVNRSKMFTFSDWFPKPGRQTARIFLSTPDHSLFRTLEQAFRRQQGILEFKEHVLINVKPVKTRVWHEFQTASPIVLVKENHGQPIYHSFQKGTMRLQEFEALIKESGILRYRKATGEHDFILEEPLFEEMRFRREIAVPVRKNGRRFPVIGSEWSRLKFRHDKSIQGFIEWLADAGLGHKCSLGFGFLQNLPKTRVHLNSSFTGSIILEA